MLLTTAGIALARKIKDGQEKKRESRQGVLRVGDSELAKRAFANQTTTAIEDGKAGIVRTGTEIKFEGPADLDATSPAGSTTELLSPRAHEHDTKVRPLSRPDDLSPVKSDRSSLAVTSPASETDDSFGRSRSMSQRSSGPPPYSARSEATPTTPSSSSRDWDSRTFTSSDASSLLSNDSNAIKVRTKGSDLKSGFPYHPALFDLNVHPSMWDTFTHQIVETTKMTGEDTAKVWAAATATAMTGAIVTAAFVGR